MRVPFPESTPNRATMFGVSRVLRQFRTASRPLIQMNDGEKYIPRRDGSSMSDPYENGHTEIERATRDPSYGGGLQAEETV